ncbi:MAG: hypothetical protein QXQ20_08050 [Candidatus Nezhaarchaeales archaeon]
MKEWLSILNEVRNDREHGAMWLASRSIDAFKCLVESLWGSADLEEELELLVEAFKRVRPSMASLRNTATISSNVVKRSLKESRSLSEVLKALQDLKDHLEKSKMEVARKATELLKEYNVFLTHSLSSTVLEFLRNMNEKLVIVTESRPRREGAVMARQLAYMGHKVKLIADASAYQASKIFGVEIFVFGVDTALRDGHVINKVGTAQIATAINELGVKNVALCESIKVDAETPANEVEIEVKEAEELLSGAEGFESFNIYFDITPPQAIHVIVMEDGPHYRPYDLKTLVELFDLSPQRRLRPCQLS